MPTSATGSKSQEGFEPLRRYAEHGFTLIELMVVITIIALASAAVIFAIPDPRGRVIDEAERFAARVHAARDDAIVQGRDVRVSVSNAGYSVERRRRGTWEIVRDKPMQPVNWAAGTGVSSGAVVAFDSTGTPAEPAAVTLVRDDARVTVNIAGNGAIRVGS